VFLPAGVCDPATPTISLGSGPVAGVLEGPGRNATVSCGLSTPGPDAFFLLTLEASQLVDLRVDAPAEVFIAVLTGCGARVGLWSCGAPPVGGGSLANGDTETSLRVPLPAGRYTIIVDTVSIGAAAASFTLSASVAPPEANAACATPTALDAKSPKLHEFLALGGPPVAACGGAASTLYYAVDISPGNQLTVGANATAGDEPWTPQVAAFDACDATACLERGTAAAGTNQRLTWTNNGGASHTVIFSVSSDGPVAGAEFDLTVGLTDLLATPPPPI
jgi:hypothetical protein